MAAKTARKQAQKTRPISPRRRPTQARSKDKVEWLLVAAARVFRTKGYQATTNQIAKVAGVSIGTLYEYFPNKEALLLALAERHVAEAERHIHVALEKTNSTDLLPALQQAVLASHRYPSTVIAFIADPRDQKRLQTRVVALRKHTLDTLETRARAASTPQPKLQARIAFGLIAELTSATLYEADLSNDHAQLAADVLKLALSNFAAGSPQNVNNH